MGEMDGRVFMGKGLKRKEGSTTLFDAADERLSCLSPVIRRASFVPHSLKYARILVTLPALWIAFIPPIADLNESHIYSPDWSGHARFHTFWLLSSSSLLSLLATFLLWKGPRAGTRESTLTSAAIVGSLLAGFFSATLFRPVYEGTLSDLEKATGASYPFDPNLLAFSFLSVLLIAGVVSALQDSTLRGASASSSGS